MKSFLITCAVAIAPLTMAAQNFGPTVSDEYLSRGVVALATDQGVFLSWRSLVTDAADMAYDVYRDDSKLTSEPLTRVTCFSDPEGSATSTYQVRCLVNGEVVDTQSVQPWTEPFLRVHLDRPEGGTCPAGGDDSMPEYTYTPDDVSVGDVDGDGEYELFVKWFPTNQADNSFRRFTGKTYIDCYRLDGTKLWRIDLGVNIRSGNHYTQFMVYDFDGDGKAELMCKTAPGTIDGVGNYVVMGDDDPSADYRSTGTNSGIILSGPEYLTVFEGATGAQITSTAYNPPRNIISNWGDSYGNRCERYLACVAYLDGQHPSAVFCRGYYTASYLWAVDFDGKEIKQRWLHESKTKGAGAYGEGAHSITVGDVDGDGCDEIVYGACGIDHDGSLMYRTGAGHGDALHLAAMMPERDGLQVFMPHEEKGSAYKWDDELRDARTGEILYGNAQTGQDNGRGLAANVSSKWPGYEYWSSKHRNPQNHGEEVSTKGLSINFRVYWDGDLLDELLDGTNITKPNNTITSAPTIMTFGKYSHAESCNSTKATPNLQADILGDWREEVILHDGSTQSDLLIFTTAIPTEYKVPCLMQDRQYRMAVAWQNVAYNQPPHLGYNLEEQFNSSAAFSVTEGMLNQVVNVGEPIQTISFVVKRAVDIEVVEAPAWMHIDFNQFDLTGTITGIPDQAGEYAYRIATKGSEDGSVAYLEGKIVAHKGIDLTLMAEYPFDEVSATTPNTVFGVAEAQKSAGTAVTGCFGNALHLDGTNYYVQAPYEALDFGADDFTVELWMRTTDTSAYMLHKGSTAANASTGATGNWFGIEIKNGQLKFAIDDDVTKTGIDINGASKWLDGEWHHVVFVRDTFAKSLYAYVDGELQGDATDLTGAVNCADEALVIGNVNVSFNNTFVGDIDQLSIYRGAMSAAKVSERHALAGITDVVIDGDGIALYSVVDAMTGRIVREAYGVDRFDLVDSLSPGVYLLVRTVGDSQEVFKVVR